MRIAASEDKENEGGGPTASTSYAPDRDARQQQQHAPAAFAQHKSTRFAPRGDVKCLVSYTAGAADAAKRSGGGEANANRASAAAAAPLDAAADDAGRRRRRQQRLPPAAAAETTPAPAPRRVEWEAEEEEEPETPLTQQQRSPNKKKNNTVAACFLLDLVSWRDPPLSLLALAAASAALFFALSSKSPLFFVTWAASPLVSHLASGFYKKSLLSLLCHLALFDLGVNSLRGLISEKLRQRGDLSGSVVEGAAAAAAASMVKCLCSLRDAALNPRDPKVALRTALLLAAAGSCFNGGGSGSGSGSSFVTLGALERALKVSAVSGFYLSFAAGAAWRWWLPRRKKRPFASSSNSSRRPPRRLLRPDDLSAAASLATRRLSASLSAAARKTKIASLVELFTSLLSMSSLGTRVALGSLAAVVAWRLSAWSTRGTALLLLLLFARAHVLGEKASKEMTRRAMRHPVLASARKGCAALGSAARERVEMRRRRRRREEEEEEEKFFEGEEEEEDGSRGRERGAAAAAAAAGGSSDLYSSRLQAAANDAQRQQQQLQQQFPHSSRPAAAAAAFRGIR